MRAATKLYRKPFWWMLALFVLIAAYYFFLLRRYYSPIDRYIDPFILRAVTVQFSIVAGLVLVEAGTYWLIRKRIYRRLWANLHIISMYLTLVVTPIIFFILRYFFPPSMMANIQLAQGVLFWLCIVAGHLCFIATIVKSFSRPQPEQQHADNTANILDEFTQ